MKKIVIAATAVGTAIAGIILYLRNSSDKKQVLNGFKARNDGLGRSKRLGQHAMG